MPNDHLASRLPRPRGSAPPANDPQLPAFCRNRRPVNTVFVKSTRGQYLLLVLLLVIQLSTLLLVIAGPAPQPQVPPAQLPQTQMHPQKQVQRPSPTQLAWQSEFQLMQSAANNQG